MRDDDTYESKSAACEAADDIPVNPDTDLSIGAVIARRFSRREILKGSLGVTAATALFGVGGFGSRPVRAETLSSASFAELAAGVDERHHVAEGYTADVLLRWGDALFPDMAPFDPRKLTGEEQARRFGYNNDYVAFFPLGSAGDRGLLCVNHEYVDPAVMFPGLKRVTRSDLSQITEAHVAVEMAAHGVTVIEIMREGERWRPVLEGKANRRITASTPMTFDGPAAGHARVRTSADPAGLRVLGTLNNCAGGHTPWGTYPHGRGKLSRLLLERQAQGSARA
jgi:secreted PhoX family phosphatase